MAHGSESPPEQLAGEALPKQGAEPCNVADYERLARERLDPGAYGYYAGGAGDERTLRENVEAFSRWLLRPRALVDVSAPTTEPRPCSAPGSRCRCWSRRSRSSGSHIPTASRDGSRGRRRGHGDGALHARHLDARRGRGRGAGSAALVPALRLPRPGRHAGADRPGRRRGLSRDRPDRRRAAARPAGARPPHRLRDPRRVTVPSFAAAVGHAAAGTPAGHVRPHGSVGELARPRAALLETTLPVLVKGIETAEDARLACEHGAAGSSSRTTAAASSTASPATIDALPEVVEAVDGRVEVLVDGGCSPGHRRRACARARGAGRARRPGAAVGARRARRAGRARGARAAAGGDRARAGTPRLPLACGRAA